MSDGSTHDAPHPLPRGALVTVWFTLYLDLLAFGMIVPVLPYYTTRFGASEGVVALLSSTFSLAQFVMSPVLGRISDVHGRRRVMLISITGSVLAMLVLSSASALWMVFLARLVSGTCNANVSTAHAYVADAVRPSDRARYMGMMGSAIGLGFATGPALGGFLAREDWPEFPFVVAAALAATNLVMAWRWLPESVRAPGGGGPQVAAASSRWAGVRDLVGTPLGWIATVQFLFFFGFAAMESTFALFTRARFGWGELQAGWIFSAVGVVILFTQGVLVGAVVARLRERNTLALGLLTLAVGLVCGALAQGPVALVCGFVLIAVGNGFVSPSVSALVSLHGAAARVGANLGVVASLASLGRILGPVAAGPSFELVGEGAPMIIGSVTMLTAVVVVLFALPRRSSS